MRELDDKDLRKLFHLAGHHAPKEDLAARIMARVSVAPIARPSEPAPLIGRWGWVGMGVTLAVLVVAAILSPNGAGTASVPYLDHILAILSDLRLPQGDWPKWMIGASLVTFVFVALDRLLSGMRVSHVRH